MKARAEEITERRASPSASSSAAAAASATSSSRCSCCSSCTAAHDPEPCGRPPRSTRSHELADGGYVDRRRRRPARPTRTGSSARSSTGCSCTTSNRCTRSRPTTAARIRLARVLGYRDSPSATALEQFDAEHRDAPGAVRSDPRAAVLRAAARDPRGHRRRCRPRRPRNASPRSASPTSTRTRAAVRELAAGPHPPLARHAADAAADARVAVGDARPRPRPAAAAAPGRGPRRGRPRWRHLPRAARGGRAGVPPPRDQPAVGDALRRHPEFVAALDDDARSRPGDARRARRRRADTLEWRGDQEQRREGLRRFKRRELLAHRDPRPARLRAARGRPDAS